MVHPASKPTDRVLLIEGKDDEHVTKRLCERSCPDLAFSFSNKEDVDSLVRSIDFEARIPGRKALGILVDANDNLQSRWDAVANRIRQDGLQVPITPDPNGTIIEGDPRIGIWIMPDNGTTGELENFVIQMIPDADSVWPLAQRYVDGIPMDERRFTRKKTPRAQLYAWLAVRDDPRAMGLAIHANDLNVDGDLCKKFVAWLERLFGDK